MDSSRQIFVLNYHFDKEMYETVVLNGMLQINKEFQIQNIEYVQYVGEEKEEEQTNVQDDLSQPLQLNIEEPPVAAEEPPVAAEEPNVAEEPPVAAEEPTQVAPTTSARSYKFG
jgi:hypothetical protein